jgi:hypothetical protein
MSDQAEFLLVTPAKAGGPVLSFKKALDSRVRGSDEKKIVWSLPADAWQEAQAISILSWCASGMHPLLARINNPAKSCDFPGSGASIRALAQKDLFENFHIADDMRIAP